MGDRVREKRGRVREMRDREVGCVLERGMVEWERTGTNEALKKEFKREG